MNFYQLKVHSIQWVYILKQMNNIKKIPFKSTN